MASKKKIQVCSTISSPEFLDSQASSRSTSLSSAINTDSLDWNKCILCQVSEIDEKLRCPGSSKRSDAGGGYITFASTLSEFDKIGELPFPLSSLDDGSGVAETLSMKNASWHKSCEAKYTKIKLERALKKRKLPEDLEVHGQKKATRQSISMKRSFKEKLCIFCAMPEKESDPLREISTFETCKKIQHCASMLQSPYILGILAEGDLIAREAKYHAKCIVKFYRQAANHERETNSDTPKDKALEDIIQYMEIERDSETTPIFKLSNLGKMYAERMKENGLESEKRVHTTRLKNSLLKHLPYLEEQQQGREVLLVFKQDIPDALMKACDASDEDDKVLEKAINVLRKKMLTTTSSFSGRFEKDSQENSVPDVLLKFITGLLHGAKFSDDNYSQSALSIAQLIQFNTSTKLRHNDLQSTIRHSADRETPLAIYLAMKIHGKTRSRELVDMMFDMGLSVSYERLQKIGNDVANRVIKLFNTEHVVCPPGLRHGLLTMGVMDNIDHNPSSTTSRESFHGTSISLIQCPKTMDPGRDRSKLPAELEPDTLKHILPLPEFYTEIEPVVLPKPKPDVPNIAEDVISDIRTQQSQEENKWLEHVREKISEPTVTKNDTISWSAFHASKMPDPGDRYEQGIAELLPLFKEQAKSPAMVRHAMNVIKAAVQHLNPGQTVVIEADQPLYLEGKKIQWNWPNTYGEDKFVFLLGGLHIEMNYMKALGNLLEDSGWTTVLSRAKIAGPGTADSFLKAAHVTRARHAHQVTLASLHILLKQAYTEECNALHPPLIYPTFDEWIECKKVHPTFLFWFTVMDMEMTLLVFVRSLRTGNFPLYIESTQDIAKWMFATDHHNYARALAIQSRDLSQLQRHHPALYREFMNGDFVLNKTLNRFSSLPLDHVHEQNNGDIKGEGGAVGLTDNESALRRWMVAGPEVSRLVKEFESTIVGRSSEENTNNHHEQNKASQTSFQSEVQQFVHVMDEMGNPFRDSSNDLVIVDTKELASDEAVSAIKSIKNLGQEQFTTFMNERLKDANVSVFEPIRKNRLPLSRLKSEKRKTSSTKWHMETYKNDADLFSKLYIVVQVRGGDLNNFFQHENQAYPPSLSERGVLRPANSKSDLVTDCLEKIIPGQKERPAVDCEILDGASMVHILEPGKSSTFQQYSQDIVLPHIVKKLEYVQRLDIVWDRYLENSLKQSTRDQRGSGRRHRVLSNGPIPSRWSNFLSVSENKSELFQYLAKETTNILVPGKDIYTTIGQEILSNGNDMDTESLAPCTHEESDTRIFVHALDAAQNGHRKILIRGSDTDIVVLAASVFAKLNISELWVSFGQGKSLRYIPIHNLHQQLGEDKASALPFFHALTGCDTVSSIHGKGKKSAWEAWRVFEEMTPIFKTLSEPRDSIEESVIRKLERFFIILYDRGSTEQNLTKARIDMFTRKGKDMFSIPPTSEALLQHVKRAALQASHIWGQTLITRPTIPSPSEWGWQLSDGRWIPVWTLLPQASEACRELTKCGCKKGCQRNCKCRKTLLDCTLLCNCKGQCQLVPS